MKMSKFITVETYETSSATIFYRIPLKGGYEMYLTRRELVDNLPQELVLLSFQRGRAFQRSRSRKQRMKERQLSSKKELTWID